jgi:hypothetical protein
MTLPHKSKEIVKELSISPLTVKSHVSGILGKMGVTLAAAGVAAGERARPPASKPALSNARRDAPTGGNSHWRSLHQVGAIARQ